MMHVLAHAGLVQSVLAAALSQAGKSVLHIDRYVLLQEDKINLPSLMLRPHLEN